MTERKFTDDDVIKALEHCTSSTTSEACNGCPFSHSNICEQMSNGLEIYALDLINRQKGLLELSEKGLKIGVNIAENWEQAYKNAKAEAIKEFAERLKKRECSNAYCCWCAHSDIYGRRAKKCDEPYIDKNGKEQKACFAYAKFESYIDKFVKEMTEGKQ